MIDLKQPSPFTFCQLITPDIARQYLDTSIGNRDGESDGRVIIDRTNVEKLKAVIRRGEWQVTNQGIGFNSTGQIRDGHHRMIAVIETGIPITCNVTLGLGKDVYLAIDQGLKRSTVHNFGGSMHTAQAVNQAANILSGRAGSFGQKQIRTMYQTRIASISNALEERAPGSKKIISTAPVRLTAIACILDGENQEFVFGQYTALICKRYENMTPASQSFMRQIESGKLSANSGAYRSELMCRARIVFTSSRSSIVRIQVNDAKQSIRWIRPIIAREYANAGGEIIKSDTNE